MAEDFTVEPNPGAATSEEADAFSKLERKLKGQAAQSDHRRTQWVENTVVIGVLVIGGCAGLLYLAALVVVAVHNLAPDCPPWRWLPNDQVHKLEAVIFSSAAAAILGAVGKKYIRLSH